MERQRRVCITARIDGLTGSGESWSLELINVHFENRSSLKRFGMNFGKGRMRQAKFLLGAIPPADYAIIGGDFNVWYGKMEEPAIEYVRDRFPLPEKIPTDGTQRYGTTDLERQIDFIFFRLPDGWKAYYRRLENSYGSDHYPLLGWIRTGKGAGGVKGKE